MSSSSPPLLVACLCARWCRLCESYQLTFRAAAQAHPRHRFVWIDVEDESELVQDIDVENFPTLLIAQAGTLRFLGVLTPQPETLARLLRAAEHNSLPPPETALESDDLSDLLAGAARLPTVI